MSTLAVDSIEPQTSGIAVTIPNNPTWVLGYVNNSQYEGTLAFDKEYIVTGVTNSSGSITIITGGMYLCTFSSNNDNTYKHFSVNGSNPYSSFSHWHNGSDANTLVTPLNLNANDVVTAYMYTDGGGTYGHNTLFTGVLIG